MVAFAAPGGVAANEPPGWYRAAEDHVIVAPLSGGGPPAVGNAVRIRLTADGLEERLLYTNATIVARERIERTSDGRPVAVTIEDGGGTLTEVQSYWYRSDGTLRGTRRCDAEGVCAEVRWAPPAAAGLERIDTPSGSLTVTSDANARPLSIRTERDGVLEREERYVWSGSNLVEMTAIDSDTTVTTRYRDGLEVARTTIEDGRVVSREQIVRDAEGRIIERATTERGVTTVETITTVDGQEVRETRRAGVLVRQVVVDGAREETTLFRDGVPVVRERREDGELVSRDALAPDGREVGQ